MKRYCKRGHDTEAVGRSSSNHRCMQCHRDENRAYMREYRKRVAMRISGDTVEVRKRGRQPTEACRRGHIIAEVGRFPNGECCECRRARNAELAKQRLEDRTPPLPGPTVPFAPLEARLLAYGINAHSLTSGGNVRRYRRYGIPPLTADDWCIRHLGLHPFDVYGAAWFEDEVPA